MHSIQSELKTQVGLHLICLHMRNHAVWLLCCKTASNHKGGKVLLHFNGVSECT